MKITKITYNCSPDSLGEISAESFVDAFENEIHAIERYQNTEVFITFNLATSSHLTAIASTRDDDAADYADIESYESEFKSLAERAFNAACAS
jgi:hypothetical protein